MAVSAARQMSPAQFSGFSLGRNRSRIERSGFLRGADAAREGLTGAAVAKLRQHLRRGDAIGDAMVDLHQQRPPIVGEPFDDPALPQRAVAVQPLLHDAGDQPEQLGVIARIRQRDAMEVMRDVEVGVIHPFRCTEVERVSMQHLGAARDSSAPCSANADTRSP